MIDKNINDIEKDKDQMANILHEFSKNDGELFNEFNYKPRVNPPFATPSSMLIPKQIKRGDNGRYQSVDLKNGRTTVVRTLVEKKEIEIIEPQQVQYTTQPQYVDTTMEQDDDEICEMCMRKFVEGMEHLDVTWIGCDYEDCGKWYHSLCQKMTNEDCKLRQDREENWFCTPSCKE
jgi:hypothetical protein